MKLSRLLLVVGLVAMLPLPAFAQRQRNSGGGSGSQQPTTPAVNPQLVQARAARDKAQTELDKVTTKLTADYEAGDEYTAAKKTLADAVIGVNAAKEPVLAALKENPDYKAAQEDEAQAAKKLKDLKDSDAPRTQINAANDELFKKAAVTGKLESQALAADPGVKAAQGTAQAAKENMAKLKATFHDSLKDNADYAAAKKTLDDAQTKVASLAQADGGGAFGSKRQLKLSRIQLTADRFASAASAVGIARSCRCARSEFWGNSLKYCQVIEDEATVYGRISGGNAAQWRSFLGGKRLGLIVQKFGGTSVANAERIHAAASKAIATKQAGNQVAVVVSAMGDATDDLIDLAKQVCGEKTPPKREMDQLLATGEQVTIALLAMAIHTQGHEAISFTAGQIGLVTDDKHMKARIKEIDKERMTRELTAGKIVIIAGFQGITEDGDITTLGRGGSNATLVAIGAALKAQVCENYTDVDGIFTADPRIVPNARKIERISYDEMMELSSVGASVLQTRAVEFAKKYNVPLHVRNSRNDLPGTWIVAENKAMEHIVVSGCALKKDLTRVTLKNLPDRPGIVAQLFAAVGTANIVVDDIIQNVMDDGTANVSFTVEHGDVTDLKPVVEAKIKEFGSGTARFETHLAKVSVVGVGMKQSTGVAAKMFKALAEQKVNIQNISTSEIRISCIVAKEDAEKSLRAVHAAFELDKASQP